MIGRSTTYVVHSSILRSGCGCYPWVAVEADLPLDLEVVIPLEISTILQLWLLDIGFPTLLLVLHVSFACKVFLDHPQKVLGFLER
jgi:hypothetical protein